MKKIFNILLLAVFTLSVFTACEKDDDSNPVLKEPTTFSLNLPPYAANNIYDLKNAKTVELTMVFRLLQHTVFRWRLILNLQKRQKKVKQTIPN